jgi:hypothetical protein
MNRSARYTRPIVLLALLFSLIHYAWAASSENQYVGQPPHPPKEAFEACANLIAADACTMTMPDGDVLDGTCITAKTDQNTDALACRPDHMPPPPDRPANEADTESDE